jgi:hypothetical protein
MIESLKKLERNFAFKVGGRPDIKITILIDDHPVAKFHDDTQKLETLTDDQKYLDGIKDSLERCGAMPILTQFNLARTSGVKVVGSNVNFGSDSVPLQRKSSDNDWDTWFAFIREKLAYEVLLIPDTNFIIHHYYSIMKARMKPAIFTEFHFLIPRLVLLEIEAIYNRSHQDADRNKQKRLSFNAMREVLHMRNDGVGLLPPLTPDIFDSFSKVAGGGFADPIIRMEVARYRDSLPQGAKSSSTVIFLTRDLMSSMMATAENIHSMYMVRDDPMKYSMSYEQFTDFLIDIAIIFGSCKVKTETQGETQIQSFGGIWSGKTVDEWVNGTLNVNTS